MSAPFGALSQVLQMQHLTPSRPQVIQMDHLPSRTTWVKFTHLPMRQVIRIDHLPSRPSPRSSPTTTSTNCAPQPAPPRRTSPAGRELTFPRLDHAHRPDPAALAERRAASPHRSSRARPRTATTTEETKP